MSDLAAIEARIEAALDRIAEGLGKWPDGPTPEEIEQIRRDAADEARAEALASDERVQSALARAEAAEALSERLKEELTEASRAHDQLSDRTNLMRQKHQLMVEQMEKRLTKMQDLANVQARDLARLRRANNELRSAIRTMREAAEEAAVTGVTLNAALKAELDATRTQQTADRNELDAILADLTPLIQEKADV